MTSDQINFNSTYLFEMPERINSLSLYNVIARRINQKIKQGFAEIDLSNGFKKIETKGIKYYWYEDYLGIALAGEFEIKPQALMVTGIGRRPDHRGPPYASSLYTVVLADTQQSIRLFSDSMMTDEGFAVWKRLLGTGSKISVYDRIEPGRTFDTITTPQDLDKYFGNHGQDTDRYHFVLSPPGQSYTQTESSFRTRRMRELSGLAINDSKGPHMSKPCSSNSGPRRLTEMPIMGGSFNTFDVLTDAIKTVKVHVPKPQDLGNGLKKIQYDHEVFYWYEENQQIQLGVIMNVYPHKLEVTLLGKNPHLRNHPPYAVDLYTAILNDWPNAKIFSDAELSYQGFKFWENMLRQGHTISVYDTVDKKYIKILNVADFNKYTGPDSSQRYRYVLSQTRQANQSLEEIQRIAKLAGAPLKS